MRNMNLIINPITTLIGFVLILISTVLYTIPFFFVLKKQIDPYVTIVIFTIGLILLLIPDDLKNALRLLLKRKSKTL